MSLLTHSLAQIQLPPDYGDRDREAEYAARKIAGSAVSAVNSRPMQARKTAAARNRTTIIDLIASRQGICKADLIRAVGISHGGVSFHLTALLDSGQVSKKTMRGRACYFMGMGNDEAHRRDAAGGPSN